MDTDKRKWSKFKASVIEKLKNTFAQDLSDHYDIPW